MNRLLVLGCIAAAITISGVASGQDSTQKELERAKAAYAKEQEAYRDAALEAFDRRLEVARKTGDKKAVDLVNAERDTFENWNSLPASVPPAVSKRKAAVRSKLEAAYNSAIKASVRAKNDLQANSLEKELHATLSEDWPHLDLAKVKFAGDAFQMDKYTSVFTNKEFSGPIEVNLIARTEKDNIRLRAHRGSCLIFNWEVVPGQFRAARPDGQGIESGTVVAALSYPLKPQTWYKIRWQLTDEGMDVAVDDKIIYHDKHDYDLTSKSRIELRSEFSPLEVRDFHVVPIVK